MTYWLSIIVFILAYIMIVWEKVHRTTIALGAAALVVAIGVIEQHAAIEAIDFNTLGLLLGMMIIVGIAHGSGMFEYAAIRSAKMAGGDPLRMFVIFCFGTALVSAVLDNVSTVIFMVPVTVALADRLNIDPRPFFFGIIISSNIGGTATLIGDPPNIMIGSAVGLGFLDFVANLALPATAILAVTVALLAWIYRRQLVASPEKKAALLALDEKERIKDWALMKKSLLVISLTICGFCLHQYLHLESATIALSGAVLMLLLSGEAIEEVLLSVEWPTILFFVGLFMMVGGLEATGVLEDIAGWALNVTGGDTVKTGLIVLWLSAIASAFVDNIPFVATMIPLLDNLGAMSGMPMESIWWALALGACLGGNGTLVGASANVIVVGLADRLGSPIRFVDYLKVGFPMMILSIALANIYLYLFFWL